MDGYPLDIVIYVALWLFFIYGIAGVIVEMIYCWVIEYRGIVESRLGLLYFPINPLYGAGGVLISLVLLPYIDNPLAVFFIGLATGTALEYVTSLVMEKAFGAVYWDYSHEFLNIQGRICLKYAIFWGLLSLFLLYVLDVLNVYLLAQVPIEVGAPVLAVLLVLFALSSVLTLLTYRRVAQKNAVLRAKKEGRDAVLPNPWWGRLVDRLVPDRVLIDTFPRMSLVTEYMELTGQHRSVIFWQFAIGQTSAQRLAARRRAEQLLAAGAERVAHASGRGRDLTPEGAATAS